MNYRTEFSRQAMKRRDRLDQATFQRIERRLDELEANPYDPRISKPLKGLEGMRSSRVGDWRVLYTVEDTVKTIYIVAIRPRGEAYRRI
ncbi:MAG: type II toxin-antitoxin system RelE/ParE family toxin [Acidobacteria bacterium]|nr:type II toxin-antitoxin system RelE/ParE family toxin [Acidobacteriota bacterium]